MIRKEREMRSKTGKNKIMKKQIREEKAEMLLGRKTDKAKETFEKIGQTASDKNDSKKVDEVEIKANDEMKHFHNEQCKTCVRMRALMGSIMPHPINA